MIRIFDIYVWWFIKLMLVDFSPEYARLSYSYEKFFKNKKLCSCDLHGGSLFRMYLWGEGVEYKI
ncbi:MAG: hypothetical protein BGP14_05785 [Sphingobacteriales bacterium 44-15]|nr:MAG: hypothetical protein BGP14_05785 [Sphingobacteriales bacterium 44-15]